MVWVFFISVAVLVVAVTAALVIGRLTADPMAEPTTTTPHHGLPADGARAVDVDDVRFDTALRGYRMDQVDEVLDALAARIRELEAEAAPARRVGGDPSGD